eukprot:SAG11_NODE_443_length_9422_cov_4.441382_7_plen_221_part_00
MHPDSPRPCCAVVHITDMDCVLDADQPKSIDDYQLNPVWSRVTGNPPPSAHPLRHTHACNTARRRLLLMMTVGSFIPSLRSSLLFFAGRHGHSRCRPLLAHVDRDPRRPEHATGGPAARSTLIISSIAENLICRPQTHRFNNDAMAGHRSLHRQTQVVLDGATGFASSPDHLPSILKELGLQAAVVALGGVVAGVYQPEVLPGTSEWESNQGAIGEENSG